MSDPNAGFQAPPPPPIQPTTPQRERPVRLRIPAIVLFVLGVLLVLVAAIKIADYETRASVHKKLTLTSGPHPLALQRSRARLEAGQN